MPQAPADMRTLSLSDPLTVFRVRLLRSKQSNPVSFGPFDSKKLARTYARGYADAINDLVEKGGFQVWHDGAYMGGS